MEVEGDGDVRYSSLLWIGMGSVIHLSRSVKLPIYRQTVVYLKLCNLLCIEANIIK